MARVIVSAKQLPMPSICVCCGSAPTTTVAAAATRTKGKRVVRSETHSFRFPACSQCVHHASLMPNASSYWTAVWLPPVIALFLSPPLAVMLAIVSWPLLFVLYRARLAAAYAARSESCQAVHNLVSYVGWHGTEHTFTMDSFRFAQAFVEAARAGRKNVSFDYSADAPGARPPSAKRIETARRDTTIVRVALAIVAIIVVAYVAGVASRSEPPPPARGVPGPPVTAAAPIDSGIVIDSGTHTRRRHRR